MDIVISLSEETYNKLIGPEPMLIYRADVGRVIKQGTVLPKGHGDLIDRDTLYVDASLTRSDGSVVAIPAVSIKQIQKAPVIIRKEAEE